MSFTAVQLQAIKAAIAGNLGASALWTAGNPGAIANILNSATAPVQNVWKPAVRVTDLLTAVVWSEFLQLDQAHRDAWSALTLSGVVDATNVNIQAGFAAVFQPIPGAATPGQLAAIAQRPATVLEALFLTNSVSAVFGLTVTEADVRAAMGT